MARVPGRDNRIAIPALVLSAVVIAALVWFAVPGMPLVVAWAAGAAAGAPGVLAPAPTASAIRVGEVDVAAADCRELYPNELWNELTWSGDAILAQTPEPPATTAVGLLEALAPTSSRTCRWTNDAGGAIVTTYSTVAPEAAALAEAALRGQGFACEKAGRVLVCASTTGAVNEEHAFADTLWVTTVASSWPIEQYDSRLRAYLWP